MPRSHSKVRSPGATPCTSTVTIASENPEKKAALARLQAVISQVSQQLEAWYGLDEYAAPLKWDLETMQGMLQDNTAPDKMQMPSNATKFIQVDPDEQDSQLDDNKYNLLYPLRIALYAAFPTNRYDDQDRLIIFKYENGQQKPKSIPKNDRKALLPTSEGMLHSVEFLIEKAKLGKLNWKDGIRTLHYAAKHKISYQSAVQLSPTQNVMNESLLTIDRKGKQRSIVSNTMYIPPNLITIDHWLILRGVSQARMLFWNEQFKANEILSEYITTLCEYSAALEEKSYCTDASTLTPLDAELQSLAMHIKGHPFAEKYLQIKATDGEDKHEVCKDRIGQILSNLTSPTIYDLVRKGTLKLEAALQLSADERKQYEQKHQDALWCPKWVQLVNKADFIRFLNLTGLTQTGFQEMLRNTNQPLNVLQNLLLVNWGQLIFLPGNITPYVDKDIPQRMKANATLLQFLEKHNSSLELAKISNREQTEQTIDLNAQIKQISKQLEEPTQQFKKILESSKLAHDVLCDQYSLTDLIDALSKHGNLIPLLQEKDFQTLLSQAKDFCFNAKEEAILHMMAVKLLSPNEGLCLLDNLRQSFVKYYDRLHGILTRQYAINSTQVERDALICKHLERIKESVHSLDGIAHFMKAALDALDDNKLFDGLVQSGILDPEEVLTLDSSLTERFHKADVEYNSESLECQRKEVRDAGYYGLADIVSRTPALKIKREKLDALKISDGDEAKTYLEAKRDYFQYVLGHTESVLRNISSGYARTVQALRAANIEYGVAIIIPSDSHQQIQAAYDRSRRAFAKYKTLANKKKLGKHETLLSEVVKNKHLDLAKSIVEAWPNIQATEVYPQVERVIEEYAQSKYIEKYFRNKLMNIDQVLRLTPVAYEALKSARIGEYFRNNLITFEQILQLEPSAYEALKDSYWSLQMQDSPDRMSLFKKIIKRDIPEDAKITQDHIKSVVQNFEKIYSYLELPLLRAVIDKKNFSIEIIVDTLIEYSQIGKGTYSEDGWEEGLNTLVKGDPSIKAIIGNRQNKLDFLATAYSEDPANREVDFSLAHIQTCMERYLSNLSNPKLNTLRALGFERMSLVTSSTTEQETFWQQHRILDNLLSTLLANRNENNVVDNGTANDLSAAEAPIVDSNNRIIPPIVTQWIKLSIQKHPTSLTKVTGEITTICETLEEPIVKDLIEEGVSPKIGQLSMPLIQEINSCLYKLLQAYPQEEENSIYQDFTRFINEILDHSLQDPAIEDLITQASTTLSSSVGRALFLARKHTAYDILSASSEMHTELMAINQQLDSETIQAWSKYYSYENPVQMVIDIYTFKDRMDTVEPLMDTVNQLSKDLQDLAREGSVYQLVTLGVAFKTTMNLSRTSRHKFVRELGIYKEKADKTSSPYKKERMQEEIQNLVHWINKGNTDLADYIPMERSARPSRATSTRPRSSYAQDEEIQTGHYFNQQPVSKRSRQRTSFIGGQSVNPVLPSNISGPIQHSEHVPLENNGYAQTTHPRRRDSIKPDVSHASPAIIIDEPIETQNPTEREHRSNKPYQQKTRETPPKKHFFSGLFKPSSKGEEGSKHEERRGRKRYHL